MKYEKLAKEIIELIGGKENVNSVVHCVTRLRFKLKDEKKADTDKLKNHDGVITVMQSGGQYQVVIGNHVNDVYKAVVAEGGFESAKPVDADDEKSEKSSFIDIVASIFTPVLGLLAATGMIKGFNALFVALGWISNSPVNAETGAAESTYGIYAVLNAVGDGFFYFLPIFLGYTAIKKFGGTTFIGMAIGAALVHPSLATIKAGETIGTLFSGTMFESAIQIKFLGIPVILMSYASSVIPIILAAYVAAKVENKLRKITPDVVKSFGVPALTLIIVVPLTFLLIGPVATWAGLLIGQATLWVYESVPVVAGLIVGGFWQVFVIFGLHWGLVPIKYSNLAAFGSDPFLAMTFAASFAQIGAVLAVIIRTKNKKLKSLGLPAFLSGLFGVTEPAIYGITLPLKKPFIMSCIAGGIGGAIIAVLGARSYMAGPLGIFAIPTYISPEGITSGFYGMLIAIVVAFVIGFILTYLFGVKNIEGDKNKTKVKKEEEILSPMNGVIVSISNVPDKVFASETMGKGIAIEPVDGRVVSPVDGVVTTLFETKHAIGITSDNGAEILIHIGMDTVNLRGDHFVSHIKQGDQVKAGDLLVEFDIKKIINEGYSVLTPVIVTNTADYSHIESTKKTKAKEKEIILTVTA